MGDCALEEVMTLPALGQDVQLGMLYDARTATLFSGISLWKDSDVNVQVNFDPNQLQNSDFKYSFSLEEARNLAGLDIEGSLNLDLKLLTATASAQYLNTKKSSSFEARVDVSCTVQRRTRRIPQETLSCIQFENYLENLRYTHFVSEVIEGGAATISLVQSCKSVEEANVVSGHLKLAIVEVPVGGSGNGSYKWDGNSSSEQLKISYSGAIVEEVATVEDARRVAREMPTRLARQMNTLSFKLMPLSVINNMTTRAIRNLDANLVKKTVNAIKKGHDMILSLRDLQKDVLPEFLIPMQQVRNFLEAYICADTKFEGDVRLLLPLLRDGTTTWDGNIANIAKLTKATTLFEHRTGIADRFLISKKQEIQILQKTIDSLVANGFEKLFGCVPSPSIDDIPRLLLVFGGMGSEKHLLQMALMEDSGDDVNEDKESCDLEDDHEEWFENFQTMSNFNFACMTLSQLRTSSDRATVKFGITIIDKVYRPGLGKRVKTSMGDIVLDSGGKFNLVNGLLPVAPTMPTVSVCNQSINVGWNHRPVVNSPILISGYLIQYRPKRNEAKDTLTSVSDNELFMEKYVSISDGTSSSSSAAPVDCNEINTCIGELRDNCDFEVLLRVETIVGSSPWSQPVLVRTVKLPSTASCLIDFYTNNRDSLARSYRDCKPWEMVSGADSSQTLYLGYHTTARRDCTDELHNEELALKIVDVAHEFRSDIQAHEVNDAENTKVIVFVGCSGHGKSTEINAFPTCWVVILVTRHD